MNKEEARNRLMDYLYDEMDSDEKAVFEKLIETDEELREELAELRSTRSLFSKIQHEAPKEPLFVAREDSAHPLKPTFESPEANNRKGRGGATFYTFLGKAAAVAAVLLIGVLFTAFAGIEFGKTDSGFYLTIGETAAEPQPALTEDDILNLVTQLREENAIMMATMLDEAQAQQNEQLEEAFNVLTNYYEERRQQDLLLISEGFNQLEQDTYSRFRQTDQTLDNLIYALSNP
jgi:hypothetical protein